MDVALDEENEGGMKFPARSKYHARPALVDGIRFASQAEGRRYAELKLLEKAGEISDLELQPTYPIHAAQFIAGVLVGSARVAAYRGDFRYLTKHGVLILEDVKSAPTKTETYRLKKKLVEAQYGITITEVTA